MSCDKKVFFRKKCEGISCYELLFPKLSENHLLENYWKESLDISKKELVINQCEKMDHLFNIWERSTERNIPKERLELLEKWLKDKGYEIIKL